MTGFTVSRKAKASVIRIVCIIVFILVATIAGIGSIVVISIMAYSTILGYGFVCSGQWIEYCMIE
jgi:hypothetical protein